MTGQSFWVRWTGIIFALAVLSTASYGAELPEVQVRKEGSQLSAQLLELARKRELGAPRGVDLKKKVLRIARQLRHKSTQEHFAEELMKGFFILPEAQSEEPLLIDLIQTWKTSQQVDNESGQPALLAIARELPKQEKLMTGALTQLVRENRKADVARVLISGVFGTRLMWEVLAVPFEEFIESLYANNLSPRSAQGYALHQAILKKLLASPVTLSRLRAARSLAKRNLVSVAYYKSFFAQTVSEISKSFLRASPANRQIFAEEIDQFFTSMIEVASTVEETRPHPRYPHVLEDTNVGQEIFQALVSETADSVFATHLKNTYLAIIRHSQPATIQFLVSHIFENDRTRDQALDEVLAQAILAHRERDEKNSIARRRTYFESQLAQGIFSQDRTENFPFAYSVFLRSYDVITPSRCDVF